MTNTLMTDGLLQGKLRGGAGKLHLLGMAMAALGVVAILFPLISTTVVTLLAGGALLVSGCFILLGCFAIHGTGPFFGGLTLSLLSLAAGTFLIFDPAAGAVGLTILLWTIFLVQGASEISFAFAMRPLGGWTIMLLSGATGVAMAVLIAVGWPEISAILLGFLMGFNFLTTGLGYIFVSRAARSS